MESSKLDSEDSTEEVRIKLNEFPNLQANKVRTQLLIYVNNDNISYLKNSKVMLNSEMPKEIIKKYEQFEKKFDNPFVMGSFKLTSRSIDAFKTYRKETQESKQIVLDHQLADFIDNKKISCAHKKLKISPEKTRKPLPAENYCSRYSLGTSPGSDLSFLSKLLSEEERRKTKILEGYEKLKSVAKSLNFVKFNQKSIKTIKSLPQKGEEAAKQLKKQQYEDLFELLEYKGIEFKNSQNELDKKLFLSYSNQISEDQHIKRHPNSQEKSKTSKSINKKNYSNKEIILLDNKRDAQCFSSKKTMPNLPPRNKDSDSKSRKYSRNKSPSTKFSSEFTSKMNSCNGVNNFASFDKFRDRHPCYKEDKETPIDYENFRENLNSSTIQIREECDSMFHSDNADARESSQQIINLKPVEWSTNGKESKELKEDKEYLSPQSIYTSYDPKEFNSNTFMREPKRSHLITDNYEEYENYISKLSCPFNVAKNLEEKIGLNYMNVATLESNNAENSFITNSDNSCSKVYTSVSNQSNITRSFSIVSKSSSEIDV